MNDSSCQSQRRKKGLTDEAGALSRKKGRQCCLYTWWQNLIRILVCSKASERGVFWDFWRLGESVPVGQSSGKSQCAKTIAGNFFCIESPRLCIVESSHSPARVVPRKALPIHCPFLVCTISLGIFKVPIKFLPNALPWNPSSLELFGFLPLPHDHCPKSGRIWTVRE